jgi:hypothetical protein
LNINANPQTILFADDRSAIVSNQNNAVFTSAMKWFKANLLSLNLDKTYRMEFRPKLLIPKYKLNTTTKLLPILPKLKFLGLVLHKSMSWKSHTDMLATKLNKACYIARAIFLIIKLTKDNLSCVFSFSYNIWTNFLVNLFPQFEYFQTPKANG